MSLNPVKCKHSEPYTIRPVAGEFTWLVYNKTSGYVVAATYTENMAYAIISGIKNSKSFQDEYWVTEMWREPEPLVG